MFWSDDLDIDGLVNQQKYPPRPCNVPKEPAAVIEEQPQAYPSGVDDGHDGFHLA